MSLFDSPDPNKRVLISGTYNAHPVNASAAIATLSMLKKPDIYKSIQDVSDRLYQGLGSLFKEKGMPFVIAKNASAFCVYFMQNPPADLHDILENHNFDFDIKYRKALIQKGIYHIPIGCKQGSVSYAHSHADIDKTLELTRQILKEI